MGQGTRQPDPSLRAFLLPDVQPSALLGQNHLVMLRRGGMGKLLPETALEKPPRKKWINPAMGNEVCDNL